MLEPGLHRGTAFSRENARIRFACTFDAAPFDDVLTLSGCLPPRAGIAEKTKASPGRSEVCCHVILIPEPEMAISSGGKSSTGMF